MWPACGPNWARQSLMHWFLWFNCVIPSRRQATSCLLLLAMVAALFPMPISLPVLAFAKDRSQPFRCQDRPCGCRTAEQCRKQCCCFPSGQKQVRSSNKTTRPKPRASVASNAASQSSCCSKPQDSKRLAQQDRARSKDRQRQFVLLVAAQECQGVAQTFSGQAVFVLPATFSCEELVAAVAERLTHSGSRHQQRFAEPPIPPPRLIVA